MFDVFFDKAKELSARGRPFAMAIVVRREAPVSGSAGDKAIVEEDGKLHGWIGGGCTQPVIVREALEALCDGQVRLVRIAPESSGSPQPGVIEYAMECHGGGALDIYIEPVMPKTQLVIIGRSVVARTLARLGKVLNYRVVAVAPGADETVFPGADEIVPRFDLSRIDPTPQSYLVVSTQGEGDQEALQQVIGLDLPYAAFVASRKKAGEVFQSLEQSGTPLEALRKIKVPAGLDIQARTPEEIAVSILAEIIGVMRGSTAREEPEAVRTPGELQEVMRLRNMSCQHCVATVESTLRDLEGVAVEAVEIGSATIRYDPSALPRSRIVEELENAGYGVES